MHSVTALIVDVDNTVCANAGPFGPLDQEQLKQRLVVSSLMDCPRGPSDEHQAEARRLLAAPPIEPVCGLVRLAGKHLPVWFLSSRPGWLRRTTGLWLDLHGLGPKTLPGFRGLVLRRSGDRRPAELVKPGLFLRRILPRLAPPPGNVGLLDDAAEVREAFRTLGLVVYDPAEIVAAAAPASAA